ncbi:hypothetical protein [Peribacillus frigoritolerans]|uniref:hypothetical protein n=1 Tax=Peribacillus frigoritolerans TaxID=450367 RepID=UPI00216208DB|nr:hypothetical protein [Peribacillus frigoritolerans]
MRTGITAAGLRRLYTDLHKTDIEIAEFFGVDRTTIVHMRKSHNITSRKTIGEIGEEMVVKELKSRGYLVRNMNDEDKLHPFDLLVNENLRIEVKSSTLSKDNGFTFSLSEKPSNKNVESENRIRLASGRTKKLFRKTCDLMIFVGIEDNGDCHFYLIDPYDLDDGLSVLRAPLNPSSKSKYNKGRENWSLLQKNSLMRQHQTGF